MIFIKHRLFFEPLKIKLNNITNIDFVSKTDFWQFLNDVNDASDKVKTDNFDLLDYKLEKSMLKEFVFIDDLLRYDYNFRKAKTELYKRLEFDISNEDFSELLLKLNEQIKVLLARTKVLSFIDLDYNEELEYIDLFKAIDLKILDSQQNAVLKIQNILKINQELLNKNIFLANNLFQYLDENDVVELIKFLKYRKITLINVTRTFKINKNSGVFSIVYDEDKCTY